MLEEVGSLPERKVELAAARPLRELPEQDREEVGFGFEVESPPEAVAGKFSISYQNN